MSVYVTDEPFEVSQAGKEYLLYSPRAAGIDFYGDNLFTTESLLRRKPELVQEIPGSEPERLGVRHGASGGAGAADPFPLQPAAQPGAPALRSPANGAAAASGAGGDRLHEDRSLAPYQRGICRAWHDEEELRFRRVSIRSPAAASGPAQVLCFYRVGVHHHRRCFFAGGVHSSDQQAVAAGGRRAPGGGVRKGGRAGGFADRVSRKTAICSTSSSIG